MRKYSPSKAVVLLWAVHLGCCGAFASSTSSKESIAFDASLINHTVENAGAMDSSRIAPDDAIATATQAAVGGVDGDGLSAPAPGATSSTLLNLPNDGEGGFLLDERKFGFKRFLLA